jgi:hypothetical protein
MTHEFFEVAGVQVREIRFNGESELESLYSKVHPKTMPEGMVDVHVWLPPRTGRDGKPIETGRLRFFTCPVGAKGPLVSAVSRMIDDTQMPTQVRVDQIEIPAEIKAIKDHGTLADLAARMGVVLPKEASLDLKHSLLAKECQSKRGIECLDRLRTAMKSAAAPKTERELVGA